MLLFINYPKCSTCRKAKKWLDDNGVEYTSRDVSAEPLSTAEIERWFPLSGVEIKKFFNTCSGPYKELGLKDKLSSMNNDEKLTLLSENAMLVKRPLLVSENFVLVGFKSDEWSAALKND